MFFDSRANRQYSLAAFQFDEIWIPFAGDAFGDQVLGSRQTHFASGGYG
jgi:hypothetical protein